MIREPYTVLEKIIRGKEREALFTNAYANVCMFVCACISMYILCYTNLHNISQHCPYPYILLQCAYAFMQIQHNIQYNTIQYNTTASVQVERKRSSVGNALERLGPNHGKNA